MNKNQIVAPLSEEHLQSLNPGIRHTVKTLREWGFETHDSGDGLTTEYQCDLSSPYVYISINDGSFLYQEMNRLINLLKDNKIIVEMCNEFGNNPTIEGIILADLSAWINLFNVIIPEVEKV